MTEPDRTEANVVVLAGAERIQVSGRAALIIAQVALHATAINGLPVGQLAFDFAHDQVKPKLTQSFPAVHLATSRGTSAASREDV